jgi:tetratricopeptide (TPR) repeat protein
MDHSNIGTSCPRCACDVNSERLNEQVIVCDNCGYTAEGPQIRFDHKVDKKSIKVISLISSLLVVALVHSGNWGGAASEILPLKLKQLTGNASSEDLRRIADICISRIKQDCTETALAQLQAKDPSNLEITAELASFQARSGQTAQADVNFAAYFKAGGVSSEASYEYAKLLEKQNRTDEASRYYDIALVNKPDSLQVTIVHSYVNMLMKTGQLVQARTVIDSVRKQGESAKAFMTREYDEINASLVAKK